MAIKIILIIVLAALLIGSAIWFGAWDGDVPTVVGSDKGYVVTPGN